MNQRVTGGGTGGPELIKRFDIGVEEPVNPNRKEWRDKAKIEILQLFSTKRSRALLYMG